VAAKDLPKYAAALLVGAALAFPAGMMVAGSRSAPGHAVADHRPAGAGRNMFSPSVRTDPYFLEQQRKGVDALERFCARTGESCAEARAARRRIDELQPAN
jgi:hypothetical protein